MSNERRAFQSLSVEEFKNACHGSFHPKAIIGFQLFNQREFWEAHEALEEAWLAEPGPLRYLYKGILQAGVAYLHMQRGNLIGALKMWERCQFWLDPWPGDCAGLAVGKLRDDLQKAVNAAGKLGPEGMHNFDPGAIKPLVHIT